ncbi:MAG: UBA/THIF-type NAD/FAD-binding protein [Osedax symbiont Rs1]|nr:MAG: UBA/THIF-type NAD/FAD-binding protein [Osedax symbiont Rs1]
MTDYEQRFAGAERIYGRLGLAKFRDSHICVLGIGGVGSWVAEALARSGVGEITLVDADDLCISNTNRQIHALQSTIGRAKIEAMAERIADINPECLVHLESIFIDPVNVREIVTDQFDYVVDAIDSVSDKAAVIANCKRNKIPVITVGGAGGQYDPTCIAVVDLAKTRNDPLAAKVRAKLRREYGYSRSGKRFGVECVYSTEQLKYPQADGSVTTEKITSAGSSMDCSSGFGAATVVTTAFAMVATSVVLNKLMLKANQHE